MADAADSAVDVVAVVVEGVDSVVHQATDLLTRFWVSRNYSCAQGETVGVGEGTEGSCWSNDMDPARRAQLTSRNRILHPPSRV